MSMGFGWSEVFRERYHHSPLRGAKVTQIPTASSRKQLVPHEKESRSPKETASSRAGMGKVQRSSPQERKPGGWRELVVRPLAALAKDPELSVTPAPGLQ